MSIRKNGLFLGTEDGIKNAYSDEIKKELQSRLNFLDRCVSKYEFEEKSVKPDEFADIEYIFSTWNMPTLTSEEERLFFPSLKAVFYAAGTVKYFADSFLENGVKIYSAWGANAVPVAEYTVSQIILANKGYFQTLHKKGKEWSGWSLKNSFAGNYNTNVGIIGAGMIGSLVIKMLKAYKVNVFVFDPFLSDEKANKMGVTKVKNLCELFERCNVISNHLANNPQTVGMINKACFEKMSETATFINTGRGLQVVEEDLIESLKNNPNQIALLDVTWPEPPSPGSELYTLDNVYLTPHIAGSIGKEIQRMGEYMCEEFISYSEGKETRFEITKERLETMA